MGCPLRWASVDSTLAEDYWGLSRRLSRWAVSLIAVKLSGKRLYLGAAVPDRAFAFTPGVLF